MRSFLSISALAALFAVAPLVAAAQMMGKPPIPMTPDAFAASAAGQMVQIAVRVDSVKRSTVTGHVLQHETDTRARLSNRRVTLFLPGGTPVVMGSASDVVPGAVLYVYGIVTKPDNVDAKRVVIDTRYVTVD